MEDSAFYNIYAFICKKNSSHVKGLCDVIDIVFLFTWLQPF